MHNSDYSSITPALQTLTDKLLRNGAIDPNLYTRYDVKRGLRDVNGHGVLAGLTNIADIHAYETVNGESVPCEGKLFYRGIDMNDIVDGCIRDGHFGFEEVSYLLLTGELPNAEELSDFSAELSRHRDLPEGFVRDIIMEAPSSDVMNALASAVLTLYTYDDQADNLDILNVMRQSVNLIAHFPTLAIYAFQTYNHYHNHNSLIIHTPPTQLSTAETLLYLLRPNQHYSDLEARILDLALVVHADHGGGNNSTFTTRVVSSAGTDTYSAIASALCSLKGPKHGGANIKVMDMFSDLKERVNDWHDDEEIDAYLLQLLSGAAFDKSGLIYGMGHAVYSISDPRALLLKESARELAAAKGRSDEFALYEKVETLAGHIISEKRKIYKGVSANVDFYSGFIYDMLNLPRELYTPLFAVSRISGWCAHRLEEISLHNRIIRPAYKCVSDRRPYTPINER